MLVGQRAQRLGQQAHIGHFDVQVALAGTGQSAFGADDVAQVPGLDRGQGLFRQGLAVDVDLDTAGHVLNDHERAAVEHDAAGNLDRNRCSFQFFLGLVRILLLQVVAVAVATEVIGEGIALGALGGKLFLAQGDQGVFFLLQVLRFGLEVAHFVILSIRCSVPLSGRARDTGPGQVPRRLYAVYSPCLRLASRYWSRSPSSTFWQSLRSTPVRRSLIRESSST